MPPIRKNRPENESIALAFGCGMTDGSESFFTVAQMCLSYVLERKLLQSSGDLVSLVLFGIEEGGEENVSYPFELQLASWDMVKFVRTQLKPSKGSPDWLDGVVVAMDKLKDSFLPLRRIVIFSDFSARISTSMLDVVTDILKKREMKITVIGPNHFKELFVDSEDEPPAKRTKADELTEGESYSIDILRQLQDQLGDNLEVTTCQAALRHLTTHAVTPVSGSRWNCPLDIGDITINVSAMVKVQNCVKRPFTRTEARVVTEKQGENQAVEQSEGGGKKVEEVEPIVPVKRVKQMTYLEGEQRVEVGPTQVVKGRYYGASIIPFSDEDKEAMAYKAGPKCLSVLCFTPQEKVARMFILGTSCHAVIPQKGDQKAAVALSALVQALVSTKCAAVARKVFSSNRGLALVLLSPVVRYHEDFIEEYLVMNELAWKEGVKIVPFPPLSYEKSDEKDEAIDALIDSMNLMTADEDLMGMGQTEAFKVEDLREEKNAFYVHCLVERALFPDKPLPEKLPPHLNKISWPESVQEKARLVQKLFPVTINEQKKDRRDMWKRIQEYSRLNMVADMEPHPQPPPLPVVDFPKPELDPQDPESVADIKTLFRDDMFPPPKALMCTLKLCLMEGEEDASTALTCLQSCIERLRACASSTAPKRYNEWFQELLKTAPDAHGIYSFISSIAGTCGPIQEESRDVQAEEMDTDEPNLNPKATLELEKSQMLNEMF